jgi:hypothetical protein
VVFTPLVQLFNNVLAFLLQILKVIAAILIGAGFDTPNFLVDIVQLAVEVFDLLA